MPVPTTTDSSPSSAYRQAYRKLKDCIKQAAEKFAQEGIDYKNYAREQLKRAPDAEDYVEAAIGTGLAFVGPGGWLTRAATGVAGQIGVPSAARLLTFGGRMIYADDHFRNKFREAEKQCKKDNPLPPR